MIVISHVARHGLASVRDHGAWEVFLIRLGRVGRQVDMFDDDELLRSIGRAVSQRIVPWHGPVVAFLRRSQRLLRTIDDGERAGAGEAGRCQEDAGQSEDETGYGPGPHHRGRIGSLSR